MLVAKLDKAKDDRVVEGRVEDEEEDIVETTKLPVVDGTSGPAVKGLELGSDKSSFIPET